MTKNYIFFYLLIFSIFSKSFSQNSIISGGARFTVAVADDGSVYTWGNNNAGQLGIGTTGGYFSSPVKVNFPDMPNQPGVKPKIVQADGGMGSHALAIDENGNVWAWGCNCDGQLGNKIGGRNSFDLNPYYGLEACSTLVNNVPVMVSGGEQGRTYLSNIVNISAGSKSSYAIDNTGKIWSWGSNLTFYYSNSSEPVISKGLLGNGGYFDYSNSPVSVKTLNNVPASFIQIDAGTNVAYALDEQGMVWAWGNNQLSQLGNGFYGTANNFQIFAEKVKKGYYSNYSSTGNGEYLNNIVEISAGDGKGIFLDADGYVWTVGAAYNGIGGFAGGGGPDAKYAARISAPANNPNETYFSGVNSFACEGAISSSQAGSAIIKQNGSSRGELYTFGLNYCYNVEGETSYIGGQLGQGDCSNSSYYSIPTKVKNFSRNGQLINADNLNVTGVSDGNGVFYIITQDPNTLSRELWVMGANNNGQLGLGNTNSTYCVPTSLSGSGGFTLASPCPKFSNTFFSYKQFCGTLSQVLEVPGQQKNYSYKWITPFNNYTIKDYNPYGTTANKYAIKLNSNFFSNQVKYTAEVSIPGKSCPTVKYDFNFEKYPDGFTVPTNTGTKKQSFCFDSAFVNVNSLHAFDNPIYSFYPSLTSKVKIAFSKGSNTTAFKLPDSLAAKTTNTITIYAQETSSQSGIIFKKSDACSPDFNNSVNLDMLQSGFKTYEDTLYIKSVTVRVIGYPQGDSISVQFPIGLFLPKVSNGSLVADKSNQVSSFSYNFKRKGLPTGKLYSEDVDIPVSFIFYPNSIYFIGISHNTNISLGSGNCIMNFPVYNQSSNAISFIGTSMQFSNSAVNSSLSQGVFFNIKYEVSQKYCERKPVVLKNTCVITGEEEVSIRKESELSITPNPSSSNFFITSSSEGMLTMRNSSGQLINNSLIEKNESLAFGDNWKAGLYFIQFSENGKTITRKVIKY